MIWTSLFIISIAQGLFLISLIAIKGSKNPMASRLIVAMLIVMLFTNFGYLVSRTELSRSIPQFFAVPFGMMLLYGPLLFFYTKSVIDSRFQWKRKYWLHFLPYLLQVIINLPLLTADKQSWAWFNQMFLSGQLPIRTPEKITLALQNIQLVIYLAFTYRWIKSAKNAMSNTQFIISVAARTKWAKQLIACFLIFLITVFTLYLIILFQGHYQPATNYIYTIIISGVIYFIAYKLVLNPGLISPDFDKKYKTYMQFSGVDGEKYVNELQRLMTEDKLFTDTELKLASLAKEIGLPAHQVSKLINEKFGKTFTEFVNEYRVAEFIKRVNDKQYASLTIFGIAMDVGFNSKSSFNTAFKKITGKNPSDYKTSETSSNSI
jgi:AraC-like DNA-binding protein